MDHFNFWKQKLLTFFCVIILILITYKGVTSLVNAGMPSITRLYNAKGDYEVLRQGVALVDVAMKAKEIIPSDGCIQSSFNADDRIIDVVVFKYYLFPLKIRDSRPKDFNKGPPVCRGSYFIDLHHRLTSVPMDADIVNLPGGARIFAMNGAHWNGRVQERISGAQVLIGFFHFNGIFLLIGSFIFCGLHARGRLFGRLINFSSAFLTGFLVVTLIFWLLAMAGATLTPVIVWTVLYGTGFLSYFFMRAKKASLIRIFESTSNKVQDVFFGMLALILLTFFISYTISVPICITDELNIWMLKAKMFFEHQGVIFDYTEYDNNYYPILWPLNVALQYIFIGGDCDQVAKWTSAVIFVCLVGQLKWIGYLLGLSRRGAWLAILTFLVVFHHWTFFTALAENLYIALMAFALASFMYWMRNKKTEAILLTTLALVGASATKFEGVFVTIFLFIAYLGSQELSVNNFLSRIKMVMILSIPVCMHGFWLAWLNIQNVPYAIFHLQGNLSVENVITLFRMIPYFLMGEQTFLVVIFGLTLYLLSGRQAVWSREERFLLIFSAGLMLFGISAGLCWPPHDFRLYYPEVLERLFSRVMPFLTLVWMSRVMIKNYTANEEH